MTNFVTKYLDLNSNLTVADIGSQAVGDQESYKPLFSSPKWKYVGCDVSAGNNVDVVLTNAYEWRQLASESMDVVISGQAFEHIEYPWGTMYEISRILKMGGLCCIIAPSSGICHHYPVDCWRYYEDGMLALAKYVDMEVLEVFTQRSHVDFAEYDELWQDTVFIGKKPFRSLKRKLTQHIRHRMNQYLVSHI